MVGRIRPHGTAGKGESARGQSVIRPERAGGVPGFQDGKTIRNALIRPIIPMSIVQEIHCRRAIQDIAAYGDNDVLPFDIDNRFFKDAIDELETLLSTFASQMENKDTEDAARTIKNVSLFSERLLAPAGYSGFRITTKIHPFWNAYLNALAIALAEIHEPSRSASTYSYRYKNDGDSLFDRTSSWRVFRERTIADCKSSSSKSVVVQTDISSFYEHVYHHRLENFIDDLVPSGANISKQIDRILRHLAYGRSFGIPVGGQGARILAEILLASVDRTLENNGIRWHRFIDDFVLIAEDRRDAYKILGVLASSLSDLGLSLNRSKTSLLTTKNYSDYTTLQLHGAQGDERLLREIDLHFDPYSDRPDEDYKELKETVSQIDVSTIIRGEQSKAQADRFVVSQVSRTLKLLSPDQALDTCMTLLSENNLHAFRASWSTIMRGIGGVRADDAYCSIHERLDRHIDGVMDHSMHLLFVDTNALHFLRLLRFEQNSQRARFLVNLYGSSKKVTVRRACIDCWRRWKDREQFISHRINWNSLHVEEQRMVWLASKEFGDDGLHFQRQTKGTLEDLWALGVGKKGSNSFAGIYRKWVEDVS